MIVVRVAQSLRVVANAPHVRRMGPPRSIYVRSCSSGLLLTVGRASASAEVADSDSIANRAEKSYR